MAKLSERNPASAPGDWYIDRRCIDCGASREVAPGLIVHRKGESSFGAHSYFVRRAEGNLLVDSPRHVKKLVQKLEDLGGVNDILLSHQDDVADAGRYAKHFNARVWIHQDDSRAAPYATDLLRGGEPAEVREQLLAIPVPGHTKGSVVYLFEETYLFTGDSLAWSREREDLLAFRDACWYSWSEQRRSLAKLADYRFEWVLAGHGGSIRLPAEEMRARLRALVERV